MQTTNTWPELAIGLYDKLTGRGAEITYELDQVGLFSDGTAVRLVGEETFRDGMREYLSTYRYGNATWPDLITILDRLSDEDLTAWSRVWVEEPGRPTIHVSYDGGGEGTGRVVVRQEDAWGRGRMWPQTLELVASWPSGLERTSVRLEGPEAVADAWITCISAIIIWHKVTPKKPSELHW